MSGPEERDQGSGIRDQDEVLTPVDAWMTAFEREIASAFAARRVDAPKGFADRVMTRAASSGGSAAETKPARKKRFAMPLLEWRVWATGAIAAVIVVGVVQGDRIHEQHVRQAQAQQQFEATQRITDQTLAHVREQVQRAMSMQEYAVGSEQ